MSLVGHREGGGASRCVSQYRFRSIWDFCYGKKTALLVRSEKRCEKRVKRLAGLMWIDRFRYLFIYFFHQLVTQCRWSESLVAAFFKGFVFCPDFSQCDLHLMKQKKNYYELFFALVVVLIVYLFYFSL